MMPIWKEILLGLTRATVIIIIIAVLFWAILKYALKMDLCRTDTPSTPSGYNCVAGTCVASTSGAGTYASLDDCNAACGTTQTKYICQGSSCVEDPQGTYTESTCNNECGGSSPSGFNCVAGTCAPSTSGAGTYDTLAICKSSCGGSPLSCVGNANAPNPVVIPDKPGKSGFKCKTEYKLGPCPPGANGCINIKNLCNGPVWAFGQYGSPPNVFMYKKLESGESYQYVIYQDTMEAARIIFYYKDPLTMPEWAKDPSKGVDDLALMQNFKECEITTLSGGAPPNMNQLTEFTFAKDNDTQKRFMDYDVSYVDSASIPIYMYAPGSNNNDECNQTFVENGKLDTFYEGCPTGVINPSGDFKTCVGSFNWCNDPNAITDPNKMKYCTLLDDYAAKLNITPELLQNLGWVYGPTAAIYGGTFEPGRDPAGLADLTPMKTISINRGTCTDPTDKDNCGGDNAEWPPKVAEYSLDQRNDYSRWIRSKGKNYYGFSMDEGGVGGNQQCRYSTQLDIVVCPDC